VIELHISLAVEVAFANSVDAFIAVDGVATQQINNILILAQHQNRDINQTTEFSLLCAHSMELFAISPMQQQSVTVDFEWKLKTHVFGQWWTSSGTLLWCSCNFGITIKVLRLTDRLYHIIEIVQIECPLECQSFYRDVTKRLEFKILTSGLKSKTKTLNLFLRPRLGLQAKAKTANLDLQLEVYRCCCGEYFCWQDAGYGGADCKANSSSAAVPRCNQPERTRT